MLENIFFRPCLKQAPATFCIAVLISGIFPASWAFAATVARLDYETGLLRLDLSGKGSEPTLSVWPGNAQPNPSQLVILTLPDADGDLSALQQAGNLALQQHPELKKFLVGSASTDAKGKHGLKIVLEIQTPPSQSAFQPTMSTADKSTWLVTLLPESARMAQASSLPAPVTHEIKSSPISKPAMAQPLAHPTHVEPITKHTEVVCPAESPNTGTAEIQQLKQALAASNRERDELQQRLAQYEERIREYAPEALRPENRDAATIQNLRSALLKVANRLKATELALSKETAKNHEPEKPSTGLKSVASTTMEPPAAHLQLAETTKAQPALQRVYSARPTIAATTETASNPARLRSIPVASASQSIVTKEKTMSLESQIRENPRKYSVYIELATLYQEQGELSSAENILTLLLRQNPAYSMGYQQLALLYAREKRPQDAQQALENYQRLKPNDQQTILTIRQAIRSAADESPNTLTKQ